MTASRKSEILDLGALILVWMALGVPWKWRKFRGGYRQTWIGYLVDSDTFVLGISESRAEWMQNWIRKTISEGTVDVNDLRAVLGRIGFMLGVLDYLKPFVIPLFAWVASVEHMGKMMLPWSVAFILEFLAQHGAHSAEGAVIRPHVQGGCQGGGAGGGGRRMGVSRQQATSPGALVFRQVDEINGTLGIQPRRALPEYRLHRIIRLPPVGDGIWG